MLLWPRFFLSASNGLHNFSCAYWLSGFLCSSSLTAASVPTNNFFPFCLDWQCNADELNCVAQMTCAANMSIWDSNIASCKQRVSGRIFYVTLHVFLEFWPFELLMQKYVKIMAFGCNTELFVLLITCLPNPQAAPFSTRLLHRGCPLFTCSGDLFFHRESA